jgi:hypothetical protein
MKFTGTAFRTTVAAAGASALLALSACGEGDREAEAETPVSEAEVSTQLPESVVSDEQLEATANAAADIAASPPAQIVPVPVGGGQPGAGATSMNQMTNTGGQ